jgi:hypothetical protein
MKEIFCIIPPLFYMVEGKQYGWHVAYAYERSPDGVVLAWKYYDQSNREWKDNTEGIQWVSREEAVKICEMLNEEMILPHQKAAKEAA